MSAVSTERSDDIVKKPTYGILDKSSEMYSTDDDDDHQAFAEYTDTDEDASETDEDIEFHEATQPLYHPDNQQYEDEHGFTVHVRTDDEYSDDTTDSEYIEEKRRQSQMVAPESMKPIVNSDSESEYEDRIGAIYKSETPFSASGSSSSLHAKPQELNPVDHMQTTDANEVDSDHEEKVAPASSSRANDEKPVTIRPRSQKIAPHEGLQSTEASDSESDNGDEGKNSIIAPAERPRSTMRSSASIRRRSHKITPLESLRSIDTSDSENEQDDHIAPIVKPERPKSNMRNSAAIRRSSQRIITPIDDHLMNSLSSFLDPGTQEPTSSEKQSTSKGAELREQPAIEDTTNTQERLIDWRRSMTSRDTAHEPSNIHLENDDSNHRNPSDVQPGVFQSISYPTNDLETQHVPESGQKSSVDGITEVSSSHSAEGIQSAAVSDFESVDSNDTTLTTPKTEFEPLDNDSKSIGIVSQSPESTTEILQTSSPKGYVDYLEEMEQAPELPPKDFAKPVPVTRNSNRFSVQSLSEMNDISLDHNMDSPTPIAEQSQGNDNRFSLASYNNPMRHSKTLPPIDTSVGTTRRPLSSEHSSPRSGNILQNAFRLQTPVTFSNPFKRSPPSSTVTTPRSSISTIQTRPSQAYSARQSKRISKQLGLASPVVGGSVDEMLLARLEQQNSELRKDPKNRVLQNLQREAVRRSVENLKHDRANKGSDGDGDYDWEFWALCLSNFQHITRSQSRVLATNIQRGIPPSLRGMIWQMFSKSKDPVLESQYRDLLRRDSPYDKMIQRDLARTFPDHQFFKDPEGQGQTGLYNVVKAYSIYDEEVGYCQGIAFIVGALLLNMPDEEAFCVLTCLMKQYGLRGHYTPDMEGLQLHLYQYERILSEQLPHIYRYLEQKGITSTMYASQWFMTLFAYKFPLEVVFRIYDIMLSEGVESIIRFAIALLKKNEKTILSLDFEALLHFLKNGLFSEYETQQLVEDACAVNITSRRIEQLTKEHRALLVKAQLEREAIEDLQKSNADISQTIQSLELRLSTMFQEHDDVLAQLDESKKQLRHLTSENERMRQNVASLKETVEILPSEVEAMSRDEFEVLCTENATLIEKNCSLEDQLNAAESLLIDMKVKYAESENETDTLRRHLNEMRKIMAV